LLGERWIIPEGFDRFDKCWVDLHSRLRLQGFRSPPDTTPDREFAPLREYPHSLRSSMSGAREMQVL
jgi:hypothetical protein